ncbi:MAG: myo-inositol 2-dehydrogenase/D-chiro-inositol 1-dehydrogenase, partial [Maribacter sp.]
MGELEKLKRDVLTPSRRGFVKSSALLTAGMLLPGMEMSAMVNVFNDKKLKIAVVGCGGRGTGAANQALKADENVELVAMADAFQDQLDKSFTNLQKAYEGTGKINVKDKHKYV